MRIIKNNDTGLLFSPFCLAGKWMLQVATLHYFDLMEPDVSLPEQDMWQELAPVLGEGGFLDPGYPKPRGEVLLAASWHAPHGKAAPGGRAAFAVGDVRREFLVFGPRYWTAGPAGPRPSAPEPVTRVPLAWEYAYGGEGFGENPKGVGYLPRETPWGESRLFLPQVEDPASGLMGDPHDTPRPAAAGICVLDAPSRTALSGTYDDEWLKRYWPGFPPDTHNDYFQFADEAQRLKSGWFQGGESVVLEGMHPRFPGIETRLPRKRARVFASCLDSPDAQLSPPRAPRKELFLEGRARLDTVWLFPAIMRGVLIYRTVFNCADEDYSDFLSLFPVLENADAPASDIHHWQAEQQKRLASPATANPAPLENAKAMVEEVKTRIRTLEEDANFTLDKALGLAPVIPMSLDKQSSLLRDVVDEGMKNVNEAQAFLKSARKQYSHLMKIDPNSLDTVRRGLERAMESIDATEAGLRDGMQELAKGRSEMLQELEKQKGQFASLPEPMKKRLPPSLEKDLNATRASLAPAPTWSEAALKLLAEYGVFMGAPAEALRKAGIRDNDMLRAGFAFLPQALPFVPRDWGMEGAVPEAYRPECNSATIGPGYVIPWFSGPECVRLAIRELPEKSDGLPHPEDFLFAPCREAAVPGSGQGAQLLGAHRAKPLLLVPDPLTAWVYYAEVGDIFAILIATSPEATLPENAASAIANAPLALWPVSPLELPPPGSHESPELAAARAAEFAAPWAGLLPGLEAIAWGPEFAAPHPVAARRLGLSLRAWLKQELTQREQPVPLPEEEGGLKAELDEKGAPIVALAVPKVDVDGIRGRLDARVKAASDEKQAEMDGELAEQLGEINAILKKKGQAPITPPPDSGVPPSTIPPIDWDKVQDNFTPAMRKLAEARVPETSAIIEEGTRFGKEKEKVLRQAWEEGVAALRAAEAKSKMSLAELAPDWAKEIPGAEMVLAPRPMTPELALAKLRGGDTRGLSLRDMDFSGADLSGCVFSEMFFTNVRFCGAKLRDARFDKVVGEQVDFSDADLSGASFYLSSFSEAVFDKTICQGMRMELTNFNKSAFVSPLTDGAVLKLVNISESRISGLFEGLRLELFSLGGILENAAFINSDFDKGNIPHSEIKGLTLRGGSFCQAGFVECKGEGLLFSGVNARNMRIIKSSLDTLDFSDCRLDDASFRESSLSRASFARCSMKTACIDYCEMPFAVLSGCKASEAQIRHSNLEGAKLVRFSIPKGSFKRTRLVRADLTGANLYGADLYKAVLGESTLQETNLTRTLLHGAEGILLKEGMAAKPEQQ